MRLSMLPRPLIVIGVVLWQLAPLIAQATPFTYTFQPGTTTVLGGSLETITGSFTFDAAIKAESAVAITLSGSTPYAGLYTTSSIQPSSPFMLTAEDQQTQNRLGLTFEFALQFSPNPLALVFFQSPIEFSMGRGEIDNRPSGAATSPTAPLPVPEPPTAALVALGILGTALARRRTMRSRRDPLALRDLGG